MPDHWKDAVGYEGIYAVSDTGKVKRLVGCQCKTERVLRPLPGSSGHTQVELCRNGITHRVSIHKLVLEAFIGPCPEGMECRHLDGNPSNNYLENLTWGTRSQNNADRRRHGVSNMGERNAGAILTETQVVEIIGLLHTKSLKQAQIAEMFDVDFRTISQIKTGARWPHLNRPWREEFPNAVNT